MNIIVPDYVDTCMVKKYKEYFPMHIAKREEFCNGETLFTMHSMEIHGGPVIVYWEPYRGLDINAGLFELLILLDLINRLCPSQIHLIMPFIPYSRQDRSFGNCEPISIKIIANVLKMYNVKSLITLDMHSAQTESAFDFPVYNVTCIPEIVKYIIEENTLADYVFIAVDAGAAKRVSNLGYYFNKPVAFLNKKRRDENILVEQVYGDVHNKDVIIVEDIIDTGKTVITAINKLLDAGANRIFVATTHILNKSVFENTLLSDLYIANSIKKYSPLCGNEVSMTEQIIWDAFEILFVKKSVPRQLLIDSWYTEPCVSNL